MLPPLGAEGESSSIHDHNYTAARRRGELKISALMQVISTAISARWAKPMFQIVFGTLTRSLRTGETFSDANNMFSPRLVNCWGNKASAECGVTDTLIPQPQANSEVRSVLEIQTTSYIFYFKVFFHLHPPSASQRPRELASKCVNKRWDAKPPQPLICRH